MNRRLCVRVSVRPSVSTLSNMSISETSGSIIGVHERMYKHFWPDRIRTLVSMATDSSHRVKMGKMVLPLFLGCF